MWEKWSLFDEATRVPLFIYHPMSPFGGQHYKKPVELIDILPTIHDLTQAPFDRDKLCTKYVVCRELQGKSLATVVLGDIWPTNHARAVGEADVHSPVDSIMLPRDFSISQVWKCVNKDQYIAAKKHAESGSHTRANIWRDCNRRKMDPNDISVMGYSMRTSDFRYTAWLKMNTEKMTPDFDMLPLEDDLFDHRNETYADFTHQEIENIARKSENYAIVLQLRRKLMRFLQEEVVYRGPVSASASLVPPLVMLLLSLLFLFVVRGTPQRFLIRKEVTSLLIRSAFKVATLPLHSSTIPSV